MHLLFTPLKKNQKTRIPFKLYWVAKEMTSTPIHFLN